MLRALSVAILAFWSCFAFSASESAMSLLDNRFRVDPTIEQITFLVYREQSSQPVVLVRPDGKNIMHGVPTTMCVGTKSLLWTSYRLIIQCQVLGRLWVRSLLKTTSV